MSTSELNGKGLLKDGKPRQRRPGAGRPKILPGETKSIRVSKSIPTRMISALPELLATLDHWESECAIAGQGSARHYFLRQCLDELRALGYTDTDISESEHRE